MSTQVFLKSTRINIAKKSIRLSEIHVNSEVYIRTIIKYQHTAENYFKTKASFSLGISRLIFLSFYFKYVTSFI